MNSSNQVTAFNFNTSSIRVVTIEDQPWFVAADVCKALGYKNPTEFVRGLDAAEKAKKFLGSGSACNVISESGLYKATLRAQRSNPLARVFQDHVTKEILPSIRKTGAYVTGQPSLVENPKMDPLDIMLAQAELLPKLIAEMKESRRLQQEQAKVIQEQATKIEAVEVQVKDALEYASVFDFAKSLRLKLSHGQKTALGKMARSLNDAAGRITRTKEFDGQAMYPVSILTEAAKKLKIIK